MKNAELFDKCIKYFQILLLLTSVSFAKESHDESKKHPLTDKLTPNEKSDCKVESRDISAYANGESQNIRPVVILLTHPPCQAASKNITAAAFKEGIGFDSKIFHLDDLAPKFSASSGQETSSLEASLIKRIPEVLRETEPKASALKPLVAQLSVLSQNAARKLLAQTVLMELNNAADPLVSDLREGLDGGEFSPKTVELAKDLMKLGANEPSIMVEVADLVEENAILAASETLKRSLLTFARVASVEKELVPSFNFSVQGFNRGVERGKSIYQSKERSSLLSVAFLTSTQINGQSKEMDVARDGLDRAMASLMSGEKLNQFQIKKMWKDGLKILAGSDGYALLADAFADSLSFQSVYLNPMDQALLLKASKSYPALGFALQREFENAWSRLAKEAEEKIITQKDFKDKVSKYFIPLISNILGFEQDRISASWMKLCLKQNLILDEDIEKRLPKQVVKLMERRERALAAQNPGVDSVLNSMAENMAVLWTLGNVQVPALSQWVERNENK